VITRYVFHNFYALLQEVLLFGELKMLLHRRLLASLTAV
jgi:hypothetical protein